VLPGSSVFPDGKQPQENPYWDDNNRARHQIAAKASKRMKAHVPQALDKLYGHMDKVDWVQIKRGKNDTNNKGQEHQAQHNLSGRAPHETVQVVVGHQVLQKMLFYSQ
jgi:hypothetical protein